MTLRTKALLIVSGALLCMIGLIYATSRFTFMSGLQEIEENDSSRSVERVLGALAYVVTDLETDTADWAAWDDTYAFIEDGNDQYIQSNLVHETFVILRLNLMLFVNSSGRVVFGKAFDLDNETETSIPQDLLEHLYRDNSILSQPSNYSLTSGIILLNEGPMIIASQPILTSEEEGPTRGTLIFARYLNAETINQLTGVTLLPITLHPISNVIYPDFKVALTSLLKEEVIEEEAIFVKPLNTQYISGYTLLKDVYGKSALVMRVDMPRDTYRLGQVTVNYYILSILGLGVMIGALTIFMIQKQILSRFTNVISGINRIAASGDTSIRISLGGKDELSLVAGTINGMLGALEESEIELREREERYRLLAENAKDVIWTVDMNMKPAYVSPSITYLLGYSVEEVLTLPMEVVYTPASFENTMKVITEELAIDEMEHGDPYRSWMLELELNHKDGSIIPIEAKFSFIREPDGRPIRILAIARDITERKRAQESLQELYKNEKELREQVEEELQKRTEFTRALVHELKTPITPVLAAAELLLDETKDKRLLRLVQSIDRGASNLNQRIDELLDLARGETDMLQLEPESVDPVSLLREIGYEMIPLALSNGQSLTVELPPSISAVWADVGRLRQIVLNLLNNAFKYTPAEGSICLRAREDSDNLVVEVQDTGAGISKEDREHLFEPYYRRVSDRERLSGLGLGLALAKRFVELHGGRIWVSSEKGKGSTFGISLPLETTSLKEGETNPRGK
ncbi:CHASE4 domain-containing protein [Chloroflexota bacterium]